MQPLQRVLITLLIVLFIIPAQASTSLLNDEKNTINIFKKTSDFVVFVYKIRRVGTTTRSYFVPSGAGSGFIWDKRGYIVTNYHVVRGAQRVAISFGKGKAIKARIIGVEPRKDIAVLKVSSLKYVPQIQNNGLLQLADSDKLQVGQKTIAIGNPYGLDRTMTTGIISALGRKVRGLTGISIYNMIQTDASINPGNSGGPLLNSKGELIGMNTMIYSRSGTSSGIGFAVPSNTIKRIVTQLIHHGRVIQRGIGIHQLDVRIAAQLGVSGLIIGDIIPGSPADKAGLRSTYRDQTGQLHFGDIIVAIDNKRVRHYDDYYNILESKKIGQRVKVTYVRNKKLHSVMVKTVNRNLFRR